MLIRTLNNRSKHGAFQIHAIASKGSYTDDPAFRLNPLTVRCQI